MSPELRVRFATLPRRLHVPGGDAGVEFGLSEAAVAAAEQARREAEENARRAAAERERAAAAERDARFARALSEFTAFDARIRSELDGELAALEPELAKLALGIAARALGHALAGDPLLLLPAVSGAIATLRKGLEEPGLTTVAVAPAAVTAFATALGSDSTVRVSADSSFAPGQFEVRCDIRRIRHGVESELEAIAVELARSEVNHG